ncbi:Hypothetical protein Cul210931_1741 [Corynebacterium ulcerans]|nr:Hypothetical protein Cul210931_1741 [Corynebacterium ulcerans]
MIKQSWNYLRIRGEKDNDVHSTSTISELPPHTRRKAYMTYFVSEQPGTTSAYAEKSIARRENESTTRNYLRIRGEKLKTGHSRGGRRELPPHTRRKVVVDVNRPTDRGTTSAYAEKSGSLLFLVIGGWNYLRIRGEKAFSLSVAEAPVELPPHTRRKVTRGPDWVKIFGTTSAYAEKRGFGKAGLSF